MAKKQTKKTEVKTTLPRFNPSQVLCIGNTTVITDINGVAWVVDPNDGTARRLTVAP